MSIETIDPSSPASSANTLANAEPSRFLHEIARAVEWRGAPAQIDLAAAALDHREPAAMRALLHALGITSEERAAPSTRPLRTEELPALLVRDGGAIALLVATDHEIRCLEFGGGWTPAPAFASADRIYVLALPRRELQDNDARRSWTGRFFRMAERRLIWVGTLSMLMHVSSVVSSLLIMFIYDNVLDTRSLDTLACFIVALIALAWIEHRARSTRSDAMAALTVRFDAAVSELAFGRLLRQPLETIDVGGARMQVAHVRRLAVGRELFRAIGVACDIPFLLVAGLMLMLVAGPACLVPITCGVVLVAAHALTAKRVAAGTADVAAAQAAADSATAEMAAQIDHFRQVGAAGAMIERTSGLLSAAGARKLDIIRLNSWLAAVSQGMSTIAVVLTLAVSALLAMDGLITSGALFVAMTIVWRMMTPVQALATVLPTLGRLRATLARIDDLGRAAAQSNAVAASVHRSRPEGTLQASGVALRSGRTGAILLRGIDLKLEPGTMVAIAGHSGAGKSALLRVLAGLVEPQTGGVTIAGMDIRQFDAFELARSIGYVPQEPMFFSGTLMDNMRRVRPDVPEALVQSHLATLGLKLPHPALPQGLHTPLDDGAGLALGDLQRLALVREFLKEPRILLLDDAASALDRTVQNALIAVLRKVKSITAVACVTASADMLAAADAVVLMSEGQIVGRGPPSEMLPRLLSPQPKAA